jgi:tRNA modification GTPase
VVVAGPPNAGKSSLVNALVGTERAIVTDVPGTTRDSIEVPFALAGIPLLLTDTAGLREAGDRVEQIGVGRARDLIAAADILLWLGERGDAPKHPRLIRIHPRCDLPGGPTREDEIAVSAVTGVGLTELKSAIVYSAGSLVPHEDAIALNRRQAGLLAQASAALTAAGQADDAAFQADDVRVALAAFDRLTGAAGMEDMLDALFGRFCLGK